MLIILNMAVLETLILGCVIGGHLMGGLTVLLSGLVNGMVRMAHWCVFCRMKQVGALLCSPHPP